MRQVSIEFKSSDWTLSERAPLCPDAYEPVCVGVLPDPELSGEQECGFLGDMNTGWCFCLTVEQLVWYAISAYRHLYDISSAGSDIQHFSISIVN